MNAKELADRVGITAASTSALVERLVRSGHVERRSDPNDRRGVILSATGPSMHQALRVIEELDRREAEVAEQLPADERAIVVEFLQAMARAADRVEIPVLRRRA